MIKRTDKEAAGIVLCIAVLCSLALSGCQQTGTESIAESTAGDTVEEIHAIGGQELVLTEDKIFESIALHSKISDIQQIVTWPVSLKEENGMACFEVEFSADQKEYEYEIDAYTGEVIAYDFENKGTRDAVTGTTAITLEEAKLVALDWAAIGEEECVFIKEDYLADKVPVVFELVFLYKEKEFEFEILADGTIIECGMEPAEIRDEEPGRIPK